MFGLDERIAHRSAAARRSWSCSGSRCCWACATRRDPDHLTAVSTLIADRARRPAPRGAAGAGLGRSGTRRRSSLLGLPIVLFKSSLPGALQRAAEVLVGLVIVGLALRLLMRWRDGAFHAHEHRHGALRHRHVHPHAARARPRTHGHQPELQLGRTPGRHTASA